MILNKRIRIEIEEHPFGASAEAERDPTVLGYAFGPTDTEDGLPNVEYWFRAGDDDGWYTMDQAVFARFLFENGRGLISELGPGEHVVTFMVPDDERE